MIHSSDYEAHIAEKIGIPMLRAGTWDVEDSYIVVKRLWYARVKYMDKDFIISVTETNKWLKVLIGIIEDNVIIRSVVQDLEHDYVKPYLKNLDVYSDNELSMVDVETYYYRLITSTRKSGGIFSAKEPPINSKQGKLFNAFIRMAQEIASNSDDKDIQNYLSRIPILLDEDEL